MGDRRHRRSARGAASALPILAAAALALATAGLASASDGTWERAWGLDVVDGGGTGYEICTIASSCKRGVASSGLGGELEFATGVAADAAGNVYVVDAEQHRIEKFDSAGTWLRAWGRDVVSNGAGNTEFEICTKAATCKTGRAGGLGGEMNMPSAVATDAAGNVYVTEVENHRVQVFDPLGNFLTMWGRDVENGGPEEADVCTVATSCQQGLPGGLAGELDAPSGIAIEQSTGNVYVAEFANRRIQKFTADATFLRAWGRDVVDNGTGSTGAEVCRIDDVCKPGVHGDAAGEFADPVDVAIDAAGNINVVDRTNHRVQQFDTVGDFRRTWGRGVAGAFIGAYEVCTDAATCDAGDEGELGGEFNRPEGVAADPYGRIYVTETENHRIQVFDLSGGFQQAWGRGVGRETGGGDDYAVCTVAPSCRAGFAGGLGGMLHAPWGIEADAAGDVYVTETNNFRVQKFTTLLPPPPLPPPPEIDTGAPETTIIEAPEPKTKKKIARFAFSSSEPGSSFECRLDDGAFEPCASLVELKVKKGEHGLEVRATDAAGNTDPTPATHSWKVRKKRKRR